MGQSTEILGPYDELPTHSKDRITGGIPEVLNKQLFRETFTLRGVQDKIVARLFHVFYVEFSQPRWQEELAQCITMHDRELILNNILNRIAATVSADYEPTAE